MLEWLRKKIRGPWLQAHYERGLLFERVDEMEAEHEKESNNWDTAMHVIYFDDPPLHELKYINERMRDYNLRRSLRLEDIRMLAERKEAIARLEELDE